MRSYDLDPSAAAKAGVSNYITETGKYKGKFTVAESIVSQQGTEGVEFAFQTNDGMTANFLQLWTYNKDGKQLSGFNVLSAIMTCLKVKNIAPTNMQVNDFRGAAKSIQGFPDLCNKPIGLLLQKEEYEKNDKSIGFKFNIVVPFEHNLELTAGEILKQKTSAEQLPKIVATLKDRPMQKRATTTTAASNWTDDVPNGQPGDDVPW